MRTATQSPTQRTDRAPQARLTSRPRQQRQARVRGWRQVRRRWCCLLAAAGILLAAGLPALAAGAATQSGCVATTTSNGDVTITNEQPPSQGPANGCTPASGATISGTWPVDFAASVGALDSLESFSVSIYPTQPGIPPLGAGAVVSRTYHGGLLDPISQDAIQQTWDTNSLTPYNGQYAISATASNLLGQSVITSVTKILVNNPPATPTNVTASVSGGVPVVSWSANAEPDITGYGVLRSVTGGAYVPAGASTTNSFADNSAPTGTSVSYEVVAIRSSPVEQGGIQSAPSDPTTPVTSSTPVAAPVVIAPPPRPVTIKAPAVVKTVPDVSAEGVGAADNTFAPTLPFDQPAPTSTTPSYATVGPQTLAGDQGDSGTNGAQKLRYLATALFLMLLAFLAIRYARKLLRS